MTRQFGSETIIHHIQFLSIKTTDFTACSSYRRIEIKKSFMIKIKLKQPK